MAILLSSYQQTTAFTPERFNPVVVTENERAKVTYTGDGACYTGEAFCLWQYLQCSEA